MLNISEKNNQPIIQLNRGDSAELQTEPYICSDGNKTPLILNENDYILFCIAGPSGKIYYKKIITKNDYNQDNILTIKFRPNDTVNLQPFKYTFSLQYMPENGSDVYTYSTGIFELLPSIATVEDLHEREDIYDNQRRD